VILQMHGNDQIGWTADTHEVLPAWSGNTPMFSPDGKWIAYTSRGPGGEVEVYVRPFLRPGGPWKISPGRGEFPVWSKNPKRKELFYGTPTGNGNGKIMVVRYFEEGDAFHTDTPTDWSPTRYRLGGAASTFDLHPDGLRVVMKPISETIEEKHDHVVFIFNFFDELRRIAPSTKR
jgi:Tol biopolymer transport system component